MEIFKKTTIAEIKGVRVNYDHIEQIIEWFKEEGFGVKISTLGIGKTYKHYDSVDLLIKWRGKKPKLIALTGKKENQTLQVFISMQYCIIETSNREGGELEFKIIRLLKQTVPTLFKLFPFKWFVLLLILMFSASIIAYFLVGKNHWYVITYALYPVASFIIAGLYNNKVNGIYLIYSHEKASFWTRKKDDIILLILSTLIAVPIGSAIWEYLVKPYFEN